jgi:plastocyanin
MTRSVRYIAVSALAAATLLAACGSSGNETTSAGSTSDGNRGGIYGDTGDTGTSAPAGTTAGGGAPAAGGDAVDIKGFAFNPGDVSVAVGTKVTWTNDDSAKHRVKANDGSFDSKDMAQGDTYEFTFDKAGTFDYICAIHPSMKGTITVTG